jgi:hypothetical protein
VTHLNLFLENPVRLPFLSVDLPLLGFFWLGPLIFLIVHAYVLLHFVLLAGKIGDFDAELDGQIAGEVNKAVRTRLRRQLPSNIFVQFLAGPDEVRSGVLGFLLQLIAWISLVIGPVALLVFFELQFLPYHDWAITWWHRIAVLADIALLWMLWPSISRGETAGLSWRDLRRGKILALGFASLVPVLLVTAIATFPGEWLEDNLWKEGKDKPWRLASMHELLVAGEVDFAARRPKSIWSNRLVLPGFDAIDHAKFDSEAKIAALPETVSLRSRHLEGAVLIGAKLRKADFTAAQLQSARLDGSDLRDARFDCGNFEKSHPQQCAQLQGASLDWAQLQGARLDWAQLQGASLLGGELQGASLHRAQLTGARLDGAQLQGATLDSAQLQGASLAVVWVWRADVRTAHWENTRVEILEAQPMSVESFEEHKKTIAEQVPEGDSRAAALKSVEQRLDPTKPLKKENEMAKVWADQERGSPNRQVYEKSVSEQWRTAGCADDGAPYVLRGLLARLKVDSPFAGDSREVSKLAAAFLDEAHCPGAHGLSETDKAKLNAIHDRSPPPVPNQASNRK